MSRDILPAFGGVESIEAAEALSEPFVRLGDYAVLPEADLDDAEPIAVGVAYISEDGEVKYAFSLADEVDMPLNAAQEFSEGYDRTVGFYYARERDIEDDLGPRIVSGRESNRQSVVEKVDAANLLTISGFAIFSANNEDPELLSGFFLARKVFEELPLDGRGEFFDLMNKPGGLEEVNSILLGGSHSLGAIKRAQKGIMQNDAANQMYGVAMSALLLPDPKTAKKLIAKDPRIGHFLSLPRKERRKLLKEERKAN